ncbi:MAG TPA: hypothetical protein DEF07_06225, partial [Nitrosomonas sp.]|nr:hypothetical protein [Nitrosomonas sp.]
KKSGPLLSMQVLANYGNIDGVELLFVFSSCAHGGTTIANAPCSGNQSIIKTKNNLRAIRFIGFI